MAGRRGPRFAAAVERVARADGVSVNQFVSTAVAEKLAVMETATYFAERKERADLKAFRRILRRKGGEPPREGDERVPRKRRPS